VRGQSYSTVFLCACARFAAVAAWYCSRGWQLESIRHSRTRHVRRTARGQALSARYLFRYRLSRTLPITSMRLPVG
jgi:hypothetical protein